MSLIKQVFIYSDNPSEALSINALVDYLRGLGFDATNRGDLLSFLDLSDEDENEYIKSIIGTRVLDISSPLERPYEPADKGVDTELKKLLKDLKSPEVMFDGFWLQRILYRVMFKRIPGELKSGLVHIIFTGKLFGTFETKRYHARVVLLGIPSIISTSGVVEAPARPREYYWLKAGFIQSGRGIEELDEVFKGRFIEYDDPRITEVLKSYTLQVIFYEATGEAFCQNKCCCLYNSHWQEEVLRVQLEGKLCKWHKKALESLTKGGKGG